MSRNRYIWWRNPQAFEDKAQEVTSSNQVNGRSYQDIVWPRCCTWNSKIFLSICVCLLLSLIQAGLWLLRPSWLWTHRLSFPSPYVMRLQEPTAVEIMWCWQTQGLNYSRRALYWAKFWDEIIGLNVFSVRFDLSFPHPRTLFIFPFFSCGMESLFCDILYSKYVNELFLFSRDIAMRFPESQGQLLILTIENYLSC